MTDTIFTWLGVAMTVIVFIGYIVSTLWPERDDYEIELPIIIPLPHYLSQEDKEWISKHVEIARKES